VKDHSREDLSIALGCVIHDALILAIAISMRRSRHSRPKIAGLNWGEAQIAIDVILLKSRALVDFLFSRKGSPDDILAEQFRYVPSATYASLPKAFRDAINQRYAHLSWARVATSLPEMTEVEEGLDVYAGRILTEVYSFIESMAREGISPILDRHKHYWEALQLEYAKLGS
jgi:hypothetical protein